MCVCVCVRALFNIEHKFIGRHTNFLDHGCNRAAVTTHMHQKHLEFVRDQLSVPGVLWEKSMSLLTSHQPCQVTLLYPSTNGCAGLYTQYMYLSQQSHKQSRRLQRGISQNSCQLRGREAHTEDSSLPSQVD